MLKINDIHELINKKQKYVCLLYGEPGIGKSTFASSASNPILLDCENGAYRMSSQDLLRCPVASINTLTDALEIDIERDLSPYDTIIIDTIAGLLNTMLKGIVPPTIKRLTFDHWGKLLHYASLFMNKLLFSDKNIIVTAHSEEKKNSTDNSMRIIPSAPGSFLDIFISQCDLVGYMYREENRQRYITFEANGIIIAKNTCNLPEKIFIPENSQSTVNTSFSSLIESYFLQHLKTEQTNLLQRTQTQQQYNEIWDSYKNQIDTADAPEQFTDIRKRWLQEQNIWNIHERLRMYLYKVIVQKNLKLSFDKELQKFVPYNEEKKEGQVL